ncbi:uncharacterized protein (DUF1330 family) [Caballeronia udeis]|jgi:uncharacterized protein (DUF1330 family)|uniref:Uncharacterized protein (DUF1330 family) n=1 Tax=Caballeronia udeis TaxID=1232866 RepID=A0ABW8MW29_9BURK
MTAFVVVQESIENEAVFNQYRAKAPATIEAYGGKFLARGGNLEVMEGELPHKRLVIIEFPTRQDAIAWYNSAEYQEILPTRLSSSKGIFAVVDGV